MFFIIFWELFSYALYHNYTVFIDRLSLRLARINILYIKIFQALALNYHFIDENTNNKLLKYTNNAPWRYRDINFYSLIEICDKYNITLKSGLERPINSGMISLVFKGYNNTTNKNIIIKMKRHNIENTLNDAIENLLFLINILSYIPFNKYKINEIIQRNIESIKEQTNFSKEVNNMIQIKNNCKNLDYIVIPEVYEEVTNDYPNIIMMEYIEGMKIDEINQEDYEGFARQIIKFGIVTSMIHGMTHGDLHSGNILFIKNESKETTDTTETNTIETSNNTHLTNNEKYKICILDFGIVNKINENFKSVMFEIMIELFTTEPKIIAEKFLNCGVIEPKGILQQISIWDYNNMINFTAEIIQETIHTSKKANQVQIYKFLSKFSHYINNTNLQIKLNDDFIKLQIIVAMSHGVTLTLCKNDFMTVVDKVINELFHTDILLT